MRFTRENAAKYGKKGNLARWSFQNRERIARQESLLSYSDNVKFRVRDIMDQTLDKLDTEKDPQRIDRLAASLSKLAEIERQLSGRPLPGTLRPVVKAREKWSDLELPKAPEPVLAPAPDLAPEPDDAPARDVFRVEQPESTSVELPTQDVVVEGGNEGEVMGGS